MVSHLSQHCLSNSPAWSDLLVEKIVPVLWTEITMFSYFYLLDGSHGHPLPAISRATTLGWATMAVGSVWSPCPQPPPLLLTALWPWQLPKLFLKPTLAHSTSLFGNLQWFPLVPRALCVLPGAQKTLCALALPLSLRVPPFLVLCTLVIPKSLGSPEFTVQLSWLCALENAMTSGRNTHV